MSQKFLSNIELNAGLVDGNDAPGTSGQILSSTGTGVEWIDQAAITGSGSNKTYYEVKNSSGATILKGKGIMAVGTDGNSGHILIDEMVADGTVEPRYFMGVLEDSLDNGEIGTVIAFGELDQFNTNGQNGETWTNGQILWCDPDSAGDFTTTQPNAPAVKISAAFILKASTNGKIQIRVQANEGLHELHDTHITTQSDGEILVWDNTNEYWFNDGTLTVDYTNSRVGIGTTSPDVKLEVIAASPTDGVIADFVNSTNAGGTTAAIKLSNADSEACDVILGANRVGANFGSDFFISLSDSVDGTNQERFRITENGNVGIGTTSPSAKLNIYENNTSVSPLLRIENDGTGDAALNFVATGVAGWSMGLDNSDGDNFKISTDAGSVSAATKVTVDRDGNMTVVGDVTANHFFADTHFRSTDTAATLSTTGAGIVYLRPNGYDQTSGQAYLQSNGNFQFSGNLITSASGLYTSGNGSKYLQLGNGRTDDGYAYVDLVGDATYTDYGLRIMRNNGGENTTSQIIHRGTGSFQINTNEAAPISFKTNGTERMRIDGGGSVGIGTTNPQEEFEVKSAQFTTIAVNTDRNTANENIGSFAFYGRNNATTPENLLYSRIMSSMTDVTDGSENSDIFFQQINDGTVIETFRVSSAGTVDITGDLDVNGDLDAVDITATGTSHTLGSSNNETTSLTIRATNTAGSGAYATRINMIGYEGRAQGIFYLDETYSGKEWFSGLSYSAGFGNWQVGYDATGGQSEYTAQAYLTILESGNVGIGNNSPSATLDVKGKVYIDTDATYGDSYGTIGFGGLSNGYARIFGNNTNYNLYVNSGSNGSIKFRVNGASADVAQILSNGNATFANSLGVGTASPASPLHVYQNSADTAATTGITIEQDGTGDAKLQFLLTGVQRWVVGIDNSDADKFKIGRGSDWATGVDLSIDTSGNVEFGGDITASDITLSGALKGPSTFYIDPSPDDTAEPGGTTTDTGKVVILGDLEVTGTTTTVDSTVVNIADLNITLASNATSASQADGAGITIGGASATLTYASATDDFTFNKSLNIIDAEPYQLRLGTTSTTYYDIGRSNVTGNFRIADDGLGDLFELNQTNGKATFTYDVTAPTFIGDLTGNADTATKWATARTITLGGDLTGNVSIDGSANVTLTAAVVDDSHNHDGRYYTEAEADAKFTKYVDLTSQVQLSNYSKSVIALCSVDNTNIGLNSYSIGTLTFHRSNGGVVPVKLDIAIQKEYNLEGANVVALAIGGDSYADNIQYVTFDYNGTTYGGIEFYFSSANHHEVTFYGRSNFDIFGLDYYDDNASTQILNQEVYNSISDTNVSLETDFFFNNQSVLHEGNYSTFLDTRYYTETESDAKYLLNTTDTLSGNLTVTNSITAGASITASANGFIELKADQTDSAAIRLGVSSGSTEAFVISDNSGAGHLTGDSSFKVMGYKSSALTEYAKFSSTSTQIKEGNLIVDNNVGIGTTSPSTRLHVSNASSNNQLTLERTGTATGKWGIYTNTNSLYFYDNAQSAFRMVINSSGNLGIGTTSPAYKLDVRSSGNLFYGQTDLNNTTSVFRLRGNGGSTDLFEVSANGNVGIGTNSPANKLSVSGNANITGFLTVGDSSADTFTSTGHTHLATLGNNVGIGTTTPSVPLEVNAENANKSGIHINGYSNNEMLVLHSRYDQASGGMFFLRGADGTESTIGSIRFVSNQFRINADIGSLAVQTSGSTAITIDSSQNVGIGTTSPSAKLEVNGSIKHDGLSPTSGSNIDQITEFTKSLQLTADTWTDTGISGTDIGANGVYILYMLVDDYNVGGGHYSEIYSATMSWRAGNTNSSNVDEIFLHRAGHAPNSGEIQLRTIRQYSSVMKLQIKSNSTYSAADNIVFKFRRMI